MRMTTFILLVAVIWLFIYGLGWAFVPRSGQGFGKAVLSRVKPTEVQWSADPDSLLPKKKIVYEIDPQKVKVTPWRASTQTAQ